MYRPPDEVCKKGLAVNGSFDIMGCGRMCKWVRFRGEVIEIMFDNALHAPGLNHNFVLIGSLVCKEVHLGIDRDSAMLMANPSCSAL